MSNMFVKEAFRIREKSTGKTFDCFKQNYPYSNGKVVPRYNVGINGYNEWSFLFYIEVNEFDEHFERI